MKKIVIIVLMIFIILTSGNVSADSHIGGIGDYSDIEYPEEVDSGVYFTISWKLTNIGYDDFLWTEIYRGDILIDSYDCEALVRGGSLSCIAGDTITTTSTYTIKVGGFLGEGWSCIGREKIGTGYTQFTVFVNSIPSNPVTCWKCNLLSPESTTFPEGTICGKGIAISYPYAAIPQCTSGTTYCWKCVNGESEVRLFLTDATCGQGEASEYLFSSEPNCPNTTPGFEVLVLIVSIICVIILMREKNRRG